LILSQDQTLMLNSLFRLAAEATRQQER